MNPPAARRTSRCSALADIGHRIKLTGGAAAIRTAER
jgi:hypothetical protein